MTYLQRWIVLQEWIEQYKANAEKELNNANPTATEMRNTRVNTLTEVLAKMQELNFAQDEPPICSQCREPIQEEPAIFEEQGRVSYYHPECLPETLII